MPQKTKQKRPLRPAQAQRRQPEVLHANGAEIVNG
jgi:hypothetical protein